MADLDLKSATIVGVSRLLQSRQLSPVELVQATLERIEALNPRLNAYTTATPEYALERARQAEEEISKGTYRGPMHGIPYSLKDLIDTDGIRTTYGYRSHQDYVPSRSATVHTRLEEEGGVLVGKVDCHYMRSDPAKSLNPWDLSRSPGMSSSGSGASLAASMGLASIGSDTGGSIRFPAAWCGVVGLKATFGLVSRHNALGPSWSFDQMGPMAKTVEDAAIVLQAVSGYDPNDPVTLVDAVPDYRQGIDAGVKGVRVGVFEELLALWSTQEVEQAVRKAIAVLEELGAEVTSVTIPHAQEIPEAFEVIHGPESAVGFPQAFPKERLDNIEEEIQQMIERGREYTMEQYLDAQRTAAVIRQDVGRVLRKVDVIVGPTCLTPPIPASANLTEPYTVRGGQVGCRDLILRAMPIANITGLPALSVPCGLAEGSLPVGLQIMGRHLEEPLMFRMGHAFEQATEWHLRHPPLG